MCLQQACAVLHCAMQSGSPHERPQRQPAAISGVGLFDMATLPSGVTDNSTLPIPRAAFLYLVHSERLDQLSSSLQSLFKYFNNAYGYPVVLFHEPELQPIPAMKQLSDGLSANQRCYLHWQQVVFTFPDGFDAEKAKVSWGGGTPM